MQTKFGLFFSILLVFTLSACTPQATPEYVPEGAERDSIVADADLYIADVISGIEKNDYASFSQDFDQAMLNSFKSSDFEKLSAQFERLGKSKDVELINVQIAGDYFAVRYKVTYDKNVIILRIVVDKNDPRKVSGLWLE